MRHLLTLVLAALAVLVPAVAAEAKMQVAIEAEDVFVDNTANITRAQGFQALAQLRIRNQRIQLAGADL